MTATRNVFVRMAICMARLNAMKARAADALATKHFYLWIDRIARALDCPPCEAQRLVSAQRSA